MNRILIFDNYDSFTYNLVHAVKSLGYQKVDVVRNDKIDLDTVEAYDKVILSPGPGLPEEAGQLLPLVERYAPTKSMLGVCLGHQAIAQAFGARLENVPTVYHGVQTLATVVEDDYLFTGLPAAIEVGRYHSWIVSGENFPEELVITAKDSFGVIMAMKHASLDVHGVQFHPESILTPHGIEIIRNFLTHEL